MIVLAGFSQGMWWWYSKGFKYCWFNQTEFSSVVGVCWEQSKKLSDCLCISHLLESSHPSLAGIGFLRAFISRRNLYSQLCSPVPTPQQHGKEERKTACELCDGEE